MQPCWSKVTFIKKKKSFQNLNSRVIQWIIYNVWITNHNLIAIIFISYTVLEGNDVKNDVSSCIMILRRKNRFSPNRDSLSQTHIHTYVKGCKESQQLFLSAFQMFFLLINDCDAPTLLSLLLTLIKHSSFHPLTSLHLWDGINASRSMFGGERGDAVPIRMHNSL